MLEVEHVPLDERLPDLLVGPRDEHLVVVVGALGQPRGKVDGDLSEEGRHIISMTLKKCIEWSQRLQWLEVAALLTLRFIRSQ